MKKTICIAFAALCMISCVEDRRKLARQESIASGIWVDTVMFDICFNDSPSSVKSKLKKTGYTDWNGNFEYKFKDSRLNRLSWKWRPDFSFHNDSLISFSIHTYSTDKYGALSVLNEIYSVKYGTPIQESSSDFKYLFWYKGNLEIEIREDKYGIHIYYKNITTNRYKQKTVLDDDHNSYSEEYWNIHYKDKKEEELRNIGKDI